MCVHNTLAKNGTAGRQIPSFTETLLLMVTLLLLKKRPARSPEHPEEQSSSANGFEKETGERCQHQTGSGCIHNVRVIRSARSQEPNSVYDMNRIA